MTSEPLNGQIVDASSLLALLLVFVFAYFAALFPLFEEARQRPTPPARDDRAALIRRLSQYLRLGCGFLLITVMVILTLAPISWHALQTSLWSPFQTLRVGLLLVDVLLVATSATTVLEVSLVWNRRAELLRMV
jgi:hypothetical protein